ncbi:xaa-Pro aminopeptidase 1-like, partial [Hyposmocoma kahamanoa]|uniref:xaa-Pro aminopeptidase 1-like n=1 Tax=Hyposmocoma kahamanoa TaxID=1477025 RepID=UPI000E6D63C9
CTAARNQQILPVPTSTSTLPPTIALHPVSRPSTTTMTDLLPVPAVDVCNVPITSPLGRLRMAMKNTSYTQMNAFFDAFLIFFSDEHLSEEPQEDERRLEYNSGWDGVGTGVVMDNYSALWVPAGEMQRARAVVPCPWTIVDQDDPSQPTIAEWISDKLRRNGRVGGDARLTSVGEWGSLHASLHSVGLTLISMPTLLDQLWADEPDLNRRRPEFSRIVAQLHHTDYTGLSWREKVLLVRNELTANGADAMVVTALDEVAWLLNVRGKDTPHAPLLKAFVFVSLKEVRVYAPPGKLSMPVREALAVYNCFNTNNNCTKVIDYANIYADLRRTTESKVLIPIAGTFQRGASAAISQAVPLGKRLFLPSPIIYLKAQKNEAEIKGMKRAHLKDAVAMCTLLNYLENIGKSGLTEISVVTKVDATRATQAGFNGKSMVTRVAFGPNAAIPDYRPTNVTNRRIFSNSTLIIQSGGQYVEGTTIVTRTLQYGVPSKEIRRAYTTVLRSLAAMATLQIPATLPAAHTDPVARAPLWIAKQDYLHPTGYGVGAALNRREDPVVIDYRQDTNLHTFREGYFITS